MRYVPLLTCLSIFAGWAFSTEAQVVPDSSLNTSVSTVGNNFTITTGRPVGSNLFHSFQQFSVSTGGSATFDLVNTPNISTIFSRVTGGRASNIDGVIRTVNSNTPVSLFLLNPAGILFGPNARLDIGGSFIGTTANSIKFADGTELGATDLTTTPLLTMSVPIGLQMGPNSGAIQVQGAGHVLITQHPIFTPYGQTAPPSGLAVPPSQTLALLGGAIDLDGGVLTAPSGQIELGSVVTGTVGLRVAPMGLGFSYTAVTRFGDVQLRGRSLGDVSGSNAGSIQIQGRNISLQDGSVLWVQNRGLQPAGTLRVTATETLKVGGASSDQSIVSSLRNETVAPGAGGEIQLSAAQIEISDGGSVLTKTYSDATGGTIDLTTTNLVVQGYLPQAPDIFSGVAALTLGEGRSGDLRVATHEMAVQAGGYVGTGSIGPGQGGNVTVQATAITVDGVTPALIVSTIGAATLGLGGNSGDLTITTRSLRLTNSGFISTSSLGRGSAGELVVSASESIDIDGRFAPGAYQSAISSLVTFPTPAYAQAFGLDSTTPTGSAGNVTVNTARLSLSNQSSISTANAGLGDAGTVKIIANSISLDRSGEITAFTEAGEGGNITIQAQSLILRRNGFISATARGLGNGGNIIIQVPVIGGFENSDIVANALNGRGGTIQITTQGIFGLKFRDRLTAANDITASSQFGVNGTVAINDPGIDPTSGLFSLPLNLVDPSRQIATQCDDSQGSSFVVTGRGGLPDDPTQALRSDRTWADTRDLSALRAVAPTAPAPTPTELTVVPLIQATGWRRNPQTGNVELYAENRTTTAPSTAAATCAGVRP